MNQSFPGTAVVARSPKITVRGQGESLNVLGDNQRVLLTGDDTEGRFTMIESENPPGIGPPIHIHHNEDEVFYVLEGQVEFTADGETVVCEAGSMVFLPQDSLHTWKVVGEGRARMLTMLMPAGLEAYFQTLSELGADGPPDIDELLELSAQYGIEFPELAG